jgi:hypothetical protein
MCATENDSVVGPTPKAAVETPPDPTEKKLTLLLHAGRHPRSDLMASVLVDAGRAQSVAVESSNRAQLVEPGLLHAAARGQGKKELHFLVPRLDKGQTLQVTATLCERPIEGRHFVWTGEPGQSRRVSCMQCHQGIELPSAADLQRERRVFEETGKMPPLELPRLLPWMKGQDMRFHQKLGKTESSACWECHGRHMLQYNFGQSLPWRPQGQDGTRSVYHAVFRLKGDRTFGDAPAGPVAADAACPCGVHFGFAEATLRATKDGGEIVYGDVLQRHAGILSEEAGKFMGRHNVLIDWTGIRREKGSDAAASDRPGREILAKEERQVSVRNHSARGGGRSLWIDFVSKLSAVGGTLRLNGSTDGAGFRFLTKYDGDTAPKYQETAAWQALTFVHQGTTYTAVCFHHPDNPKPRGDQPAGHDVPNFDMLNPGFSALILGYAFSADVEPGKPLLVRYRLWIQEGKMSADDIQSLSDEFIDPIQIDVK